MVNGLKMGMVINKIKVGDSVLISRNVDRPFLAEVVYKTATVIIVDLYGVETAFNRINGREITNDNAYMISKIPTEAEIKKYGDLSGLDGE